MTAQQLPEAARVIELIRQQVSAGPAVGAENPDEWLAEAILEAIAPHLLSLAAERMGDEERERIVQQALSAVDKADLAGVGVIKLTRNGVVRTALATVLGSAALAALLPGGTP